MTYAGNYEEFMKNSVLDLSSIESNRTPTKSTEPVKNVIVK